MIEYTGKPYILYRDGYKYQLVEDYEVVTSIRPETDIVTDFICLDTMGRLWIKKGYAWDGPSGPAYDSPNFMRGSLVHDALYQLMRQGHLDPKIHRKAADKEMVRICREDGMWALRRQWAYAGVRLGGENAATKPRPILRAPPLPKGDGPIEDLVEEH